MVEPLTRLPVRGWGHGSIVEHLFSMPEALGLIPRTIKNKIKTCSHSSWAMVTMELKVCFLEVRFLQDSPVCFL